ncbi:MAG: VOC family protein [Bacteroidia bacterium]
MKNLNVYLNFPGNCEEALNFYKDCFKGNIKSKQTYGDAPPDPGMKIPSGHKDKILHSELEADGIYFMACDAMPGQDSVTFGNNVSLSINLDDETEQTRIFDALLKGGTQIMPLENTFWGARFGMLKDKFGINWMLNCQKEEK